MLNRTTPPPHTAGEPHPHRWAGLAVLLLAAFMNLIDVTIVNVALPSLQTGFDATTSDIEWVVATYILAFALGLLPFGRLGDVVGRKIMFLIGVSGFTLFSAACGSAPTIGTLILARAFQGLAAAMMMPQVLALAQVMFPPRERGLAFSFFGLSAGLASVAGPLVGGFLINVDLWGLGWRPIFLVNIPVGLLALAAGALIIPRLEGHGGMRNDFLGIVLAALSVFALVFPLIEGRGYGWPLWAWAMIIVSFAGFALLYLHLRRRQERGKSQLLPIALLGNGNFALGACMTTIFFSGMAGFFMVLAIFLQTGFGFTPLESGLTTVPFPAGVLASSLVATRLGSHFPRQRLAGGAIALVIGMGWLYYEVTQIRDSVDHWTFVAPLFLSGLGLNTTLSALFQTILAGVPHRDAGAAGGALQSFQQIGGALGVAIVGEVFFATLAAGMQAGAPHPAYVMSLQNALIYEMAAFALFAVLVAFLKIPKMPTGNEEKRSEEPAVMEM
jgi:EmrB/QacA subfamily drug resistance transporter